MTRRVILLFAAGLGLLAGPGAHAQSQAASANPAVAIKDLGLPCPDCNEGERTKFRTGGRSSTGLRQWPGAYWEADITGTSFMVAFNNLENIVGVYADGQKIDTQTKPGHVIQYSGLSDGPHRVRIEAQTESQSSPYTGLIDIEVPFKTPTLPAPLPRARQIEFIGDSYTVGYGNTAGKHQCTDQEIWATTNTSLAFGPLTARHYDADYQINAISGRGIVRNYDGFAAPHLPEAYPYALFDGKTEYRDANWHPQIIVIGLGTNDFSTALHAGEKWKTRDALHADYEATYVKFVQDLRAKNPQAFFILMASDQAGGEIQTEVQKVIASLQAKAESRIAFVGFTGLDYMACNWHPSTADDRLVSQDLVTFIDAHPELWQGK
jgi:lysophospholipase L1-like esterase